ncbi:MAG: hypothetical protein WBC04_24715 [Candidatus Acidiferrales bacterium]
MTRNCLAILLMSGFVCASASSTFAGGDGNDTASPAPRPIQEKRIYTNDDVDALASRYGGSAASHPGALPETQANAASSVANQRLGASPDTESVELETMTHEQDPRWYVKQIVSLAAELGTIDSRVQQLREFRAAGTGLPVGLVLSAPCEGITTDNAIQQLDLRRREVAQQIDELDDTARRNGFPPGFLRVTPELAQDLRNSIPMTPEQEQDVLTEQLQRAGRELAIVQGVVAGMKTEADARGLTLLPFAPEYGGSPTADFMQRLEARVSVLESQIGAVQDEARQAGVGPSSLP